MCTGTLLPASFFVAIGTLLVQVDMLRHLVMFMSQCTTTPVMAPLRPKFHCLLYDFDFIHSFRSQQAAGTAATCLRERRADIARSGIIPALVEIATAYQRPAVPAAANENGGDANMADASSSGEAGNGNGNGTADPNLPPCAVLTPAHPELVECCLLAGHYRTAVRLLADIPVRTVSAAKAACMASAIDLQNEGTGAAAAAASAAAGGSAAQPPSAPAAASASSSNLKKAASAKTLPGVTTETYLRYFYYLGMIRVGCDDLEGAVAAFSVCLTVPSHTVSAITIAARKKMLLCRCLLSDPVGPSDLAAASAHSDGDDKETTKRVRSTTRARLLSIHAAASPAVERFLTNASPTFSSSSPDQPGQFPGGNIGKSSSSGSIKRSRGAAGDYYDDDAMSPSAFDEGRRVSVRADSGAEDDAPETAVEQPSGADAGAEVADGKPKADGGGDGGDGGGGGAPTVDSARRLREGNSYNLGRYDSLVDAFASNDAKKFREVRESMANVLVVDGNAGLAEKVESDMQSRQVYAVAAVYEVVSLETLASDVGLKGRTAEAESLVRKMVAKGDISAKIDHESGMVYFVAADEDDDEDSDEEEEYRADLAGQMQQCIDLADRIRILDADITASGRYQQISLRKEANAKANAQSGEGDEGASSGTGGGPRGVADIR